MMSVLPRLLADNKALADERDALLVENEKLRVLLTRADRNLCIGTDGHIFQASMLARDIRIALVLKGTP